jgi:putative transcriptional regulator
MNSLIDLRKRLSLSQAELGSAIEVNQSAISQYERGEIAMNPDVALRLIDFARSRGIEIAMETLYRRVALVA